VTDETFNLTRILIDDIHNKFEQLLKEAIRAFKENKLKESEHICRNIINYRPNWYNAVHLLGVVILGKEVNEWNNAEALKWLKAAQRIQSNDSNLYTNLGMVYHRLKKTDQALSCYAEAIRLNEKNSAALNNRGNIYGELRKYEEAIADYTQVISIEPDNINAHTARANIYQSQNRREEAVEAFLALTKLKPDCADTHWSIALPLLAQGRLEEGFHSYEYRLKNKNGIRDHADRIYAKPEYSKPKWDISMPIEGKTIYVSSEQGLGDCLQFCRYIIKLHELGAKVIFEVHPPLLPIMQNLKQYAQIVATKSDIPDHDYYCHMMSLGYAFKTTLDTIPAPVPYLFAEESRIAKWRNYLGTEGFKIAICWQGSNSLVDHNRSFPVTMFKQISELEGVRLISLQRNYGAEQLDDLPEGMTVETLPEDFDGKDAAFLDSAAVMKCVDLVITSDTALSHLAGAMGVKTFTALKHLPDWRWLLDRSDSPWYPNHKLFRQKEEKDWESVFKEITDEVAALL
jgi:tetratricopeptide (TPR) repeat protein